MRQFAKKWPNKLGDSQNVFRGGVQKTNMGKELRK